MLLIKIRILLLVASAFYSACGRPHDVEPAFPPQVAEWRLVDSERTENAARYQGTPDIQVHITRMSSSTMAFSSLQSWHAEAGKLAFFKGPFFGIAESPGASQPTLNRFVAVFEKSLPER